MKNLLILSLFVLVTMTRGTQASYVGETPEFTSVQGGNIKLEANTVSSEDTDGDVVIDPNGTGDVSIPAPVVDVESLDVDNLNLNGNSLISTDTDGDVVIDPDGAGSVSVPAPIVDVESLDVDNINVDGNSIISTDTNGDVVIDPDGSGSVGVGTATPDASALLDASSTTQGVLIPRMSEAQRDAIASPANALQVFNTTTGKFNYYDSTNSVWKVSSGAGTDTLNLMTKPGFEDGIDEGTASGCSASALTSSSDVLITPNNLRALRMTCTASTGNYTVDKATGSQFAGAPGVVSCSIRTTQSGVRFVYRHDGADTTQLVAVDSTGAWKRYAIDVASLGSTSSGWKVEASSSITGTFDIDECEVTVNPKEPTYPVGLARTEVSFSGSGSWVTNTTYNKATYKLLPDGWVEYQYFWTTSGAPTAATLMLNLPAGHTIDTSRLPKGAGASQFVESDGAVYDAGTASYAIQVLKTSGSDTSVQIQLMNAGSANVTLDGPVNATSPFTWGNTDNGGIKFRLPITIYAAGHTTVYADRCNDLRNCESTFSAKVSAAGVVSGENLDWIDGNCSLSTATFTCTHNTGIFTVQPNCAVLVANETNGYPSKTAASSASQTVILTEDSGGGDDPSDFEIICQKQGIDYINSKINYIIGSFYEVPKVPGVASPKVCYYYFGGGSATLASPTECTTGTCVEVYDSCGAGSPPTKSSTSLYTGLTFASGTFAPNTPVKCDCIAYDTTTATARECDPYFSTGQNSWSSNGSGGYVVNIMGKDQAGAQQTVYAQVECKGQAP